MALGLATGPAGAALTGNMVVASSLHGYEKFFASDGGPELPLAYGVVGTALTLTGGGRYSLDHLTGHVLDKPWMRVVAYVVGRRRGDRDHRRAPQRAGLPAAGARGAGRGHRRRLLRPGLRRPGQDGSPAPRVGRVTVLLGLPGLRSSRPGADAAAPARRRVRPGRDDLRLSLTDRCNLRCTYCMPAEGLDWMDRDELLDDDEIVRLVRIGVERLGITTVRLTGGEPLLRRGLEGLVARLAALDPAPGARPDHERHRSGQPRGRACRRPGSTASTSRSTRSTRTTFAHADPTPSARRRAGRDPRGPRRRARPRSR